MKLLLSPAQTQAAIAALAADDERHGQVYLFDTDKLDLLSQGLILRLRQGAGNDLMVKVRPQAGKQFSDPSAGQEKYKCEVDVAGGAGQPSYSITIPLTGTQLPSTGREVFALLSPAQKKLLEQAHAAIDWSGVKRLAEIQSTGWQVKGRGNFRKLSLELWQWRGGQVLELSTRAKAKQGSEAYSGLQRLAQQKDLALESTQQLKTTLVLQSVTTR
ncbi:MAG: hypothetical protein WA655_10605 [Candidatus Korobacteraceae bacterium]